MMRQAPLPTLIATHASGVADATAAALTAPRQPPRPARAAAAAAKTEEISSRSATLQAISLHLARTSSPPSRAPAAPAGRSRGSSGTRAPDAPRLPAKPSPQPMQKRAIGKPGAGPPALALTQGHPMPDALLLAAIIRAGALVATADGTAAVIECDALLRYLRARNLLGRVPEEAVTLGFSRETARLDPDRWETMQEALQHLAAAAEDPRARHIALGAAAVAVADGITWPQEIAMLRLVNHTLRLGPSAIMHELPC